MSIFRKVKDQPHANVWLFLNSKIGWGLDNLAPLNFHEVFLRLKHFIAKSSVYFFTIFL